MYQGIRISGFGGQGVISAGILLAQTGLMENKNVTWFPSYGAEMRGGTANCSVVIASDEVATPIVSRPSTVIVLNEPSLAKFEPLLVPGGLLIVNSSLVKTKPKRTDIRVAYVPCNEIAEEIGSTRIANMVALGAFAGLTAAVSVAGITQALPKVFKRAKPEIIAMNIQALQRGAATKIN
jgi:2-oxoglutarate ferredoxin oxidoreductase subunit gamma